MPIQHKIVQGETTIGLAEKHGHFPDTIWNDPANASLKQTRADMNTLMPGDLLVIPDLRSNEVTKGAGRRHRFRRKGVPAQFRLQVFEGAEPRTNQSYRLEIDGKLISGQTDAQGVLETWISPQARQGRLIIGPDRFELSIDFGHLDPIEELSGVQKRLTNLGFGCGPATGEWNDETEAAVAAFQRAYDLRITGVLDAPTRTRLAAVHDRGDR